MLTIPRRYLALSLAVLGIGLGLFFGWPHLRGVLPLIKPAPSRSPVPTQGTNTTGIPLTLQPGFSISTFAENLTGARVILFDSFGNAWISQPSEGTVSLLEIQDGKVTRQNAVFRNLRKPHGLALDGTMLYIAEEHQVSRVPLYSDGGMEKLVDLPTGGGHTSRTLGIGPDGRVYISIGSSCNVCHEKDNRRAKIFSMKKDGSDFKEFAHGLRNAVFFAWHPHTQEMWATEMGRDSLGDNIPPDEVNIVKEGGNYGWPNCYGKNIHDDDFDKNVYIRNPCMEPLEMASTIDLQAHSAPLGLAFMSHQWAGGHEHDLLVAYHGSWNRTVPTGYKIVRFAQQSNGSYGPAEDFISGWHTGSQVFGRPVDLVFGPDNALYVTDDRAGLVYRVTHGTK